MADYTSDVTDKGRLRIKRNSTVSEDVKDIIKGVARMVTPRVLRERSEDIDEQIRRREGQTTDSNNRY